MRVIPFRPAPAAAAPSDGLHAMNELRHLLLGGSASEVPLPPLADVLSALLALAEGRRSKSLLPLGPAPAELVLVRRGAKVLVSYVVLESAPELRALDRPIPLDTLLARCAKLAVIQAAAEADPTARSLTLRLAERALATVLSEPLDELPPVHKSGGALEQPGSRVALAFGFDAEIVPQPDAARSSTSTSDLHALLFRGALWLWARGRRVALVRGPIMLAVARMVAAVRALVDAEEAGRAANVRLRAGTFVVGVRLERDGVASLTLGSDDEGAITIPELGVEEAALPILRLASDVLRALVSVDRTQTRNLRVTSLRDEVRALRRRVRARTPRSDSIVHEDPDGLRASSVPTPAPAPMAPRGATARILRFDTRWEAEVEGLDAASTFLCGDRLLVATPRQTVALARDDGRLLWAQREPAIASFMAGAVLVRLGSDGRVALCDVEDGEPYASAELAPRVGGPSGVLAGGGSIPPVAIVAEARDRLCAVDLRNGELRWRFVAPGKGAFALHRAGRILLVASGDRSLVGLDVATGELLWRFALDAGRFSLAPAVDGDVVIAASGEPGVGEGSLFGIDLFSGRLLWERALEAPVACAPMAGSGVAVVAIGGPRRALLTGVSPADGRILWTIGDPGAALGAACLALDHALLLNAPSGVSAIGLEDGEPRWRRRLSHPVADDVPRKLEAVLRGGALFVPSAQVHVLRPQDGSSIGDPLPCALVPDWMRVDERGWVYVAEESGHLCAMAPRPHLSLVQ